jgi:hypothetical protein
MALLMFGRCRRLFWPCVLWLAGCGSGIRTAEVTGLVTLDGKPLPGVIVQFEPLDGDQTRLPPGTGMANAQGRYIVLRPGGKSGAVVGRNTVRVLHGEGADLATVAGRSVAGTVTERQVVAGGNVIDIELRSQ